VYNPPVKNIAEMTAKEAAGVRFVLMDIDDTLTREGKLSAAAYDALWRLHDRGLKVIPVTGRPAGWCDLIAREWPADAVVGENGALVFWEERENRRPRRRELFHPQAVRNDHPALEKVRRRALEEVPGLRVARDQFARLFDLALDFAEEDPALPLEAAEKVLAIAAEEGVRGKISSIHVNLWMGDYDKLSMTELFLKTGPLAWGGDLAEVVFVGDSPNDEPMFARFPLSCAVANVTRYRRYIRALPGFVANRECGDGFAEIAQILIEKMEKG